ncbi:uncharacterized protein LOC130612263 [Hydractinia symbiolongicarpus]|uniref:uncharacterized protein LOC130612263 n=1 Tax=Hydractinia symbiolongicarpus TaxID=13093 RepID=UPI00254FAAED|nr:uncharacterized protein LOC130612263 [Hydractinia symbiolongicarpus]
MSASINVFLLVLCLYDLQFIHSSNSVTETNICKNFTENYVNRKKYISLNQLSNTCENESCFGRTRKFEVFFNIKLDPHECYINVVSREDINEYSINSGCWGYAYEYTTTNGTNTTNYSQFSKSWNEAVFTIPVSCNKKQTYNFSIYYLPSRLLSKESWTSFSKCEFAILQFLRQNVSEARCFNSTALNEKRKFVEAMCKKHSDNEEMVLADLKNRLTAENCAHEILVMSGKVDPDFICNKTHFIKAYVRQDKYASLTKLSNTCRKINEDKPNCIGPVLNFKILFDSKLYPDQCYINVTSHEDISEFSVNGCWGYAYEYTTTNGTNTTNYSQFNKTWDEAVFTIPVSCSEKQTYNFSIYYLPTRLLKQLRWSPSESCEYRVLDYLYREASNKRCQPIPDVSERSNFANILCKNFSGNAELAVKKLADCSPTFDPKSICRKSYFKEHYIKPDKYKSLQNLSLTCKEAYYHTCYGSPMNFTFSLITKTNSNCYLLILSTEDIRKDSENIGCWGFAYEYTSNGKKITNYSQFNKKWNEAKFIVPISCMEKKTYTMSVFLLPTRILLREQSWTSPNQCEFQVLQLLRKKIIENGCSNAIDQHTRLQFSGMVCKKHTDVLETLGESLSIQNCELTIRSVSHKKQDYKDIIAGVTSSAVFVMILVICMLRFIKRKRSLESGSYLTEFPLNAEEDTINDAPTVMILNRPGCELLENFLRDFAFILKSYSVNVKMALLEQNELDADGGIATYMQKNISKCDYILIMCTENTNENHVIIKHRPYEFALKIIGGMAFHENDCSRYIPIYLTSYQEAVSILPSFLNASQTFGYRLPDDISKLIQNLTNRDSMLSSTERETKDNFFIRKMMDNRKKMLALEHSNCIQEYCTKGTSRGSVVNLSSIWPSTVQSRWSSTESLDCDGRNAGMELLPSDNTTMLCKYNTMLNGKAMTEEERQERVKLVNGFIDDPV